MIETNSVFLCPSKDLFIETALYIKQFIPSIGFEFTSGDYWNVYKQYTYIAIRGIRFKSDKHLRVSYGNTRDSNFNHSLHNYGYESGDFPASIPKSIFNNLDDLFSI